MPTGVSINLATAFGRMLVGASCARPFALSCPHNASAFTASLLGCLCGQRGNQSTHQKSQQER